MNNTSYNAKRKKTVDTRFNSITKKEKKNFDERHRVQELLTLKTGDKVWITDKEESRTVVKQAALTSYLVATPHGAFR